MPIGSPDWYQRLPDKQLHVDDRPSFAPKLGRTNIEGNSSYATASPSSMEGGDLFHSSALFRPENAGALNFGTLVHSAFEHVEWWNSSSTADMLTALSNKRIDFQDSMSTLLNSIDNTHCVATTLSQAFYSSLANFEQTDEIRVFNELPVTAVIGGQLIRGYVDRIVLGILDGRVVSADIVDFKTDNLGKQNEDLPAKVKHYEPQLMAYRETISQMFKIPIETVSALSCLFPRTSIMLFNLHANWTALRKTTLTRGPSSLNPMPLFRDQTGFLCGLKHKQSGIRLHLS